MTVKSEEALDASTLERIGRELPIFPLPKVVLMPGALLPLHVFEPRYRALVEHCRDGEGLMGLATLVEGAEEDPPPIHPEIGIGEIVANQPFPDGRCNIVLQFVGSCVVEEELSSPHPFRLVRTRPVDPDTTGFGLALSGLKLMVLQLGGISPEAGAEARRLVELEGNELVDSLARKLLKDDASQRAYLVASRAVDRVAMVEAKLADFMAVVSPVARA